MALPAQSSPGVSYRHVLNPRSLPRAVPRLFIRPTKPNEFCKGFPMPRMRSALPSANIRSIGSRDTERSSDYRNRSETTSLWEGQNGTIECSSFRGLQERHPAEFLESHWLTGTEIHESVVYDPLVWRSPGLKSHFPRMCAGSTGRCNAQLIG